MNKPEYVRKISDNTGLSQKDTRVVLEAIRNIVIEALKADDEVWIVDGIKMSRRFIDEHESRNPRNGETITVAGKNVPKCKFANSFKELVK